MGIPVAFGVALMLVIAAWLILQNDSKRIEAYRRPSWDSEAPVPAASGWVGLDAPLPFGGWDELDQPNPLWRPALPPVDGGQPWKPPLVPPAYTGAPLLFCDDNRRVHP